MRHHHDPTAAAEVHSQCGVNQAHRLSQRGWDPAKLHHLPRAGWRGPCGDRDFFLQGGSLDLHRIRAGGLGAFCLVTPE